MKKRFSFWLSGVIILMFSGCSNNDSNTDVIALSKVSHSECESQTRAEGDDQYHNAPKLILTYNKADETITGEYINYMLGCDYTDAGINIEQDANGTLVMNPWNDAKGLENCVCHINIYFIIRNATMQNYHIVLGRQTITVVDAEGSKHQEVITQYEGNISFKNQSVITIDL